MFIFCRSYHLERQINKFYDSFQPQSQMIYFQKTYIYLSKPFSFLDNIQNVFFKKKLGKLLYDLIHILQPTPASLQNPPRDLSTLNPKHQYNS